MATLVLPTPPALPPLPLSQHRSRLSPSPEPLALHCSDIAFSLGSPALVGPPGAAPPDSPARAQEGGPTGSAGGSGPAADQMTEVRVVSPLPADARSVTIQPHPGSAVLTIEVRDAAGLHAVPLHCADMLSGWWQLGTDRLGRLCWQSGEAVLRLPPLQGAATVEVTLVEV